MHNIDIVRLLGNVMKIVDLSTIIFKCYQKVDILSNIFR